jgi:pimeloyl-ACP methyl ester carboxylesterase
MKVAAGVDRGGAGGAEEALATSMSRVRLPGGLSAVEALPAEGPFRHAPVLLLHGMMGGAWQFERFQSELARAGYRSLAVDYRGHHDSPPVERLGRVSVLDYLADALAACAFLGGSPVAVGQSMGGLIAQLLAERDAVRAAILVCSLPPRGVRWRGVRNPRRALRHAPSSLFGQPLVPERGELDDLIFNRIPSSERSEFFERQVMESSRAGGEIAFGLIGVDASAVTCPVLSVGASHDRLVLAEVARELAAHYGGDHLQLDGAGHYALVGEPGWREVAARLIEWLDQVLDDAEVPSASLVLGEGGDQ